MWYEDGMPHRIYDMHITNIHPTCTFGKAISVRTDLQPGTHMGYSWGMTSSKVTGFDTLSPSHTHSGAGFVLAGMLSLLIPSHPLLIPCSSPPHPLFISSLGTHLSHVYDLPLSHILTYYRTWYSLCHGDWL